MNETINKSMFNRNFKWWFFYRKYFQFNVNIIWVKYLIQTILHFAVCVIQSCLFQFLNLWLQKLSHFQIDTTRSALSSIKTICTCSQTYPNTFHGFRKLLFALYKHTCNFVHPRPFFLTVWDTLFPCRCKHSHKYDRTTVKKKFE